jgi:predicted amidophosphoribosyltransferase
MWVEPNAAAGLVGRRVALVDDVLTTGVTAAAASQALLRAGVASVQLWALARTPAPHR